MSFHLQTTVKSKLSDPVWMTARRFDTRADAERQMKVNINKMGGQWRVIEKEDGQ